MQNDQASQNLANAIDQEAHRQFNELQQYMTNVDMIEKAVARLTALETKLDNNINNYIAEAGGEEVVEEELSKGLHQKLPLARFKLELVRTTIQRFGGFTEQGEKLIEDFAKVTSEE